MEVIVLILCYSYNDKEQTHKKVDMSSFLACNSRLRSAIRRSTSSSTEGGSEPNLLLDVA